MVALYGNHALGRGSEKKNHVYFLILRFFCGAKISNFVRPRREMITPWSTNAVEITQNMGLEDILRIEEYFPVKDENADYDPMLQRMYKGLDQNVFTTNRQPEPIVITP